MKVDEILVVLRVKSVRISLNINVKKAKLLRLGISEGEEVILGNEKIDQVDFSCIALIDEPVRPVSTIECLN